MWNNFNGSQKHDKKNVDIKHPNDHHLQILFNCLARISPSIHCSADNGISFKEWATFDIKICKKKLVSVGLEQYVN